MSKFPFADAILEQTDGGLQIIKDYYPAAADCAGKDSKKFKIRESEKTASASLKQHQDGNWLVIDWGAWEKPKNAIGICQFEDNLSFGEACNKLAKLYNVKFKGYSHSAKPTITKRPRKKDEQPNSYIFNFKDEISATELAAIGPRVTNEVAKRFHLKSVHSFSYVKENEVVTSEANDDYPIFVFDFGTWQKIYQPKSADKSFRFRYAGGRPKDFVFGLDDAQARHEKQIKEEERAAAYVEEEDDKKTAKKVDTRLDALVLCSGDRDAINMASFGYNVIWLNSETAKLSAAQFSKLKDMAKEVYNLPDIDATGKKQAVKVGLEHLDIKTIWLPETLLKTKDWRGNPRKDFLDFVDLKYNSNKPHVFIKQLKKLVTNALPMKFWTEKITKEGLKYTYNVIYAEHFLKHQGFYRMENPLNEDDFYFIHIDGNIVTRTNPNKIESYVNDFLEARQMPVALRNMVKTTPYLTDKYLAKIPLIDLDFNDCDAETQFWFFNKNVVEIKAEKITVHQKGTVNKMVVDKKVIQHPENMSERVFMESFNQPHFKIFKDVDGDDDIEILVKDNPFFNFLINTSRIHWRKDLEDAFKGMDQKLEDDYFKENKFNIAGPNLNPDEKLEQKQHLINKIFAIGYLLHKYKNRAKPWFVFGIDNKISEAKESHGGSGKSIIIDNLKHILKDQFFIPGRSKKAVESEFLFDGVTKYTDYVFIDDMDPYFPFQQFFSDITGTMRVRPLHSKAVNIDFEDSPKMAGTSNFVPSDLDPSSMRRILFIMNSDYYHHNKDNEYKQTRTVADDFGGRILFANFTEVEWNHFYVFCAQCLQFFLGCNTKIEPPMDNVRKRNLVAKMGDEFMNWAEVYFSNANGKFDVLVGRSDAYEDYKKVGKKSANSFKKAVEAWCNLNGYILNPKDIQRNKDGRIIQMINGKTQECLFIKTTTTPLEDKTEDDIPF